MELKGYRKRAGDGGVTLVELLIVLAIIGMLAGILIPVFAQARENARRTVCLSQERQLGAAIHAYTADYDEQFPNGVNSVGQTRIWPGEGWGGQVYPYVKSLDVFHCPDDETTVPTGSDGITVVSYAMNGNVVEYADSDDPPPGGRTLAALVSPARTVLLFESSGVVARIATPAEGAAANAQWASSLPSVPGLSAVSNGLDNRLYARPDWTTSTTDRYATGYLGGRRPFDPSVTQFLPPEGRHRKGACYLMADGHALWLPGARVSAGLNAFLSECGQDNTPRLSGCEGSFRAAGTDFPGFTATFSAN